MFNLMKLIGKNIKYEINETDQKNIDLLVKEDNDNEDNEDNEEEDKQVNSIKISTVDNYQGEENDIIILDLVRNNEQNKIGFLKEFRRMNVAISRARKGMIVLGNERTFSVNEDWMKYFIKLKDNNCFYDHIPLYCKSHSKLTEIRNNDDFMKVSRGGCDQICNFLMECGHVCDEVCHNRLYQYCKCMKPCERKPKSCSFNHKCSYKCYECYISNNLCIQPITTKLLCGHDNKIICYQFNNLLDIKCNYILQNICDRCNQFFEDSCYNFRNTNIKCMNICNKLLNCKHKCKNICSECTEHKCNEICNKKQDLCDHICNIKCHDGRCQYCTQEYQMICNHENISKLECTEPT